MTLALRVIAPLGKTCHRAFIVDSAIQSATGDQCSARDDRCFETSIIIVNYNAGGKLLRCLSTVLRSAGVNSEILVVDNASTDNVANVIEQKFPRVTLIQSETNLGFGAGCNLAASRARSKYLVFLNPDTTVEDGWLEALIKPLEMDPGAGLVTAKILMANDPSTINTCGNTVHITGIAFCRGLGLPQTALNDLEEVAAVSGAAFAIRRTLFELLDGFDEEMFLYMEDTDLSWRARLAGWHCLYSPESVVRHYYSFKLTPLKVFYQERNRYLMLLKALRWRTLVALLPAQVLAEIVAWTFVLLRDRGNLINKVRAYVWVLRNWNKIMAKRKAAQSVRRTTDRKLLSQTDFRIAFDQAGASSIASIAQYVLNPVFLLLRAATLVLVWW